MNTFPKKDPGEKFWIDFSYTAELNPGETIVSTTLAISVIAGTDATPTNVLSGNPVIQSGDILQLIQGGLSSTIYAFLCLATTSAGRILARAALLPVQNAKDW
jgi:hypothetical protein